MTVQELNVRLVQSVLADVEILAANPPALNKAIYIMQTQVMLTRL